MMIKNLSIPSKLDVRLARAAALCLLAFAAAVIAPAEARAQWTTAGSNTTTTSNVGVGTTAPQTTLHISTAAFGNRGIINEQTSADANSALFYFRKSRAGAAAQNGDNVGSLFAQPFDGANFLNSARVRFSIDGPVTAGSAPTNIQFLTGANADGIERMRITSGGNVGIGTTAPGSPLTVNSDLNVTPLLITGNNSNVLGIALSNTQAGSKAWALQVAGANSVSAVPNGSLILRQATDNINSVIISKTGDLGVGTATPASKLHVAGNITVDGNINAKYQDLAEWVPSTQKLAVGTVVVLDTAHDNHVLASHRAYDTRVAGVISAQPGIALGEAGAGKALVATTGRVKVKVDATRAPIQIGDLIVTSDAEGVAMKSMPVEFGGVEMHRPGTIIGKALEPLSKGTGEILVLLSLQ